MKTSTLIEPKFKIGEKVFYVDYTDYKAKINTYWADTSNYTWDDIVLYGTITGIKKYHDYDGDTFQYSITVEEHKDLPRNNEKVMHRENIDATWDEEVLEDNVFSLKELKKAKNKAALNYAERIAKEEEEYNKQLDFQIECNSYTLYNFLLREAYKYKLKYSQEEVKALHKLASSPRIDLDIFNFKKDLKQDVFIKYAAYESSLMIEDKKYVKMLLKCLDIKSHSEREKLIR